MINICIFFVSITTSGASVWYFAENLRGMYPSDPEFCPVRYCIEKTLVTFYGIVGFGQMRVKFRNFGYFQIQRGGEDQTGFLFRYHV